MFGFGNSEEKKDKAAELRKGFIESALVRTFGTSDPETINEIWRTYMPEITEAILKTDRQTSHLTDDHVTLYHHITEKHDNLIKNTHEMHDEMMTEIRDLKQQNKELQEKVNAMMNLLARQAEKENGRGR